MLKQISILLLLCTALKVHAYTLLDPEQIHDTRPRWTRSSGMPGTSEFELFYMLQWRPDRSLEVQFINTSSRDMHFNFQFERLQPARLGLNARVSVLAGKTLNVPLKIARLDQRAWGSQLRLWNFCHGEDTLANEVLEKNRPKELDREFDPVAVADKSEQAFYSYPTKDLISYNPQMLPYFIMRKAADSAEVHFRNLAQHSLNFDFRVLNYQDGMEIKNPRVILRPMEDKEVVVPCARMDDHIPYGLVEVFNIRAGEDRGPYVVDYSDGQAGPRLIKPHTWNFVGADVFGHNFNPWSMGQRTELQNGKITGVRFFNTGDQTVHFDFMLAEFQGLPGLRFNRVVVEAGKESLVPLELPENTRQRTTPIISNVRVGEDRGAFAGAPSDELVPKIKPRTDWLFVTAADDVFRFNPRAIEYQIKPTPEGADVFVRNLSDKALYFDWRIGGFQNELAPGNSRVELPPAMELVLKAKLEKASVRVAIAQLVVFNIRIGKDDGPLLAERK